MSLKSISHFLPPSLSLSFSPMEAYSHLLERTRAPQPSLQRHAVVSIFSALRSSPPHLSAVVVSQCLRSPSPAVVDQSVRELCRLVAESKFPLSSALLELQAALEGCDARAVGVFVKGIGFLVRVGFRENGSEFRVSSLEAHPFVKVLSCRGDVQSELLQQVLLFMSQNKSLGMVEVCDFLRPFLNFSIIKIPLSASYSTFVKDLIASMSSFCCAFPLEAMPVIKLLLQCFRYFPSKNAGESLNLFSYMRFILDAYIVVLKHLVEMGREFVIEAQQRGVELLDTFFSLLSDQFKCSGGIEPILEASKHLLNVQKVLGLRYIPEFSTVVLSLFISLIQSEVEHEQLSILKLLLFLIKWKDENELMGGLNLCEELLFIFPVISLASSPCKSVKQAAMDLLSMLEKLLKTYLVTLEKDISTRGEFRDISRPQDIIYRIFQRLLGQDQPLQYVSFVSCNSSAEENVNHMQNVLEKWSSLLRECSKQAVERRKSSVSVTRSQEIFLAEMPLLLGAIATVLVVHNERGSSAINLLSVIGSMDPKLCVPLLLVVLFYNHLLSGNDRDNSFQDISLKLLEMLPTLALHSMMTPFIVQTILPMLQKDAKPILYATATRLLCKAWETNDRVFGSLQGVLHPNGFTQFLSERDICLSMSASIRDVCRKNPDRGVDLILSVSACIESQDPIIKALGFESLSYLCEADVIDFYTAWDVISEHVMDFLGYPNVASSVCLLLRWGAMDAEAYPEAAANVLTTLWKMGASKQSGCGHLWSKARASAFEAIGHYEVLMIQKSIPDFREMNIELITSEVNTEVLRAVEVLEVKIITFEHITRKRFSKEKRVPVTRVEKLLNVFPDVLFPSGNVAGARQLPGAALYFLSLTPEDGTKRHQNLQGLQDIHGRYETALVEIAASLQLSRNSLTALISMQSWIPFMQRWMRDCIILLDAKTPSTVLDKTLKAGNGILKIIRRLALDSLPSSAENIALALGALCEILPPSAHSVKSSASTFLLDWLFQHEHEYRQWSAAISLGYISSCLHVTDHRQKSENIKALTEVALCSRSTLVKGACGIGLGFSCHDLISTETFDISNLDKENYKLQEVVLLGKTVRALCQMICQFDPSASELLESISIFFALDKDVDDPLVAFESVERNCDDLEEDVWGIAGLVIGLGSSIGALYRAGAHEAVHKIKAFIISRILSSNSSARNSFSSKSLDMAFYIGSCLALPSLVTFCLRVELMQVGEIDYLVNGVREIISELLSIKKSGTLHQSLLMGSCVGGGGLLGCILNEGVYSLGAEVVKDIMSLFRKTYSDPHPPLIHFGGMLGVVNALGVGAGTFVYSYPKANLSIIDDQKQAPSVTGPLLSSPVVEPQVTSMIQEMFLVAQNSDDPQLQHYAAWTVSLLRHHLFSKEVKSVEIGIPSKTGGPTSVSQYFPEDSVAMKLSLWLMHLKNPETSTCSNIYTVSTVLRCLSQAPRLPSLDWVAIVRRCMVYEGQFAELFPDFEFKRGIVREECIKLSISHAAQFSPLLSFVDELTNLPRFRMLELNLQSWILSHLSDLIKVFSGSRLEKLIDDITDFLSFISGDEACTLKEKSLLRTSCWKGIYDSLDGNSADSQECVSNLGKCMEVLFSLLPPLLHSAGSTGLEQVQSEEWSAGVRCLTKAKQSWLLELLQVSEEKMVRGDFDFFGESKRVQAKARLVQTGSISLSELGKLKAYLLNTRLDGVWDVLLEVVACLQHVEVSVKRQWLVDAMEISCVTNYPSTAMQFVSLLCGISSKYMPLLIVDQRTVLSDMPVTLSSLLSDSNWAVVAESVASLMWSSTLRIYDWATRVAQGEESHSAQSIDSSEIDKTDYLLQVMHHACVCLKDYLPPEKQLKLANLAV